jgi:ribosomal protein S13
MTDSFLFDKILPFTRKEYNINKLNIKQLFEVRFGIGSTISNKINIFSGSNKAIKFNKFKENDLNMYIKYIFEKSLLNLDELLKNKMIITLQENIDTYSYKGYMYLKRLPINGQSRRFKKRTNRRVRPININK